MRSGRFLQRLTKLRNPNPKRKQRRPRAWHNARRDHLKRCAACALASGDCAGVLEAHDIEHYAVLQTAQQNSIDFLLSNFRTLCRYHHRQQHPHLAH